MGWAKPFSFLVTHTCCECYRDFCGLVSTWSLSLWKDEIDQDINGSSWPADFSIIGKVLFLWFNMDEELTAMIAVS